MLRSGEHGVYFLGDGWSSFVKLTNAVKGSLLLFKYGGALDFDVTVFQPTYVGPEGVKGFECALIVRPEGTPHALFTGHTHRRIRRSSTQ